jgi:hypothetical protein
MTSMDVAGGPSEDDAPPPTRPAKAPARRTAESAAKQLVDGDFLDLLFDKVDAGELQLTGKGGFIPTMIKAVLERGLQVELAEHLGYHKGVRHEVARSEWTRGMEGQRRGSKLGVEAQGCPFHPGATGKGKTGRVNCLNLR